MSRVLAFDFGASTGRAILAEYKTAKSSTTRFTVLTMSSPKKTGISAGIFRICSVK